MGRQIMHLMQAETGNITWQVDIGFMGIDIWFMGIDIRFMGIDMGFRGGRYRP